MLTNIERQKMRQKIESNTHEIFVLSFDEMENIIISSNKTNKSKIKTQWEKVKNKVGYGASYYASADDAFTVAKLIGDLGGVGTRVYIKSYGGKPHIILKGHPGLRKILTSAKYGVKNPKVISMGLGKTGAMTAARQGGIITIVLLTIYRVADYFLSDQSTLSQLIGSLATDVVKVGIATSAAILAVTTAGAFTLAIGPIVAVLVVGFTISVLLEVADNRLGITKRVIAGLDQIEHDTKVYVESKKAQLQNSVTGIISDTIDQTINSARSLAIIWVRKKLHEYISPYSTDR